MKKRIAIAIVLTIISMFSFLILFNDEKNLQLNNMENAERQKNSYEILISSDISKKPQEEVYAKITKILDKYHGNIYYSRLGKGTNDSFIKYVYLTNLDYLKNFNLTNGRFFNKSDNNTNNFLSTKDTGNSKQIGKISDFAGDGIFEIHTLKSMIQDNKLFDGTCVVSLNDNVSIDSFIKELGSELNIVITLNTTHTTPPINSSTTEKIVLSLYFIILLIILYDILKSYKKIGVQKMLGVSTIRIWLNSITSLITLQIIIATVVSFVASLFKFKVFNQYYWHFIIKLLLMNGLLIFTSVIVCSIPYIYVNKITVSNMLKNKQPMKEIMVFNIIVKTVFIIIFLIMFSQVMQNYGKLKTVFTSSFSKWEDSKEYSVIGSYKNMPTRYRLSTDLSDKEKELYKYFNNKGALLADFSYFTSVTRSMNLKAHQEPWWTDWVTVNPNYLKQNIIYDINNKQINISESDNNYIALIPEKYHSNETEIRKLIAFWNNGYGKESPIVKQPIKIIWIKTNQKLFSYNISINPNDGNYVPNCFIRVITESNAIRDDYLCVADYLGSPFKIKVNNPQNPSESILPKLKELKLDVYDPPIYSIYDEVGAEINQVQDLIKWVGSGLIILVVIISSIVLQNIYSFFEVNKQRLAIQQFHGYKKTHKYENYFIIMFFSWIIIFNSIILIQKFEALKFIGVNLSIKISELFYLSIVIAVIEAIISLIILSFVEKRKIIKVIKGS